MKLKLGVPDGERGGHRRYRLTGPVWKTGVVRESKGREMEREADLRRLGEFDGGVGDCEPCDGVGTVPGLYSDCRPEVCTGCGGSGRVRGNSVGGSDGE